MHTGKPFSIFQDRNDLEWGENWRDRIEGSLGEVTFLIPVVTPSYFNSPACRREFELFLEREVALGSSQLILPIYYLSSDPIEDPDNKDAIGAKLRSRQYSDWRPLRFVSLDSAEVASQLSELARDVKRRTVELTEILKASTASKKDYTDTDRAEFLFRRIQAELASGSSLDEIGDKEFERIVGRKPRKTPVKKTISELDRQQEYSIYTSEFDETVKASELLSGRSAVGLTRLVTGVSSELENSHRGPIAEFEKTLKELTIDKKVAVTLLLDNSGSLRGRPISFLAGWSLVLAGLFDQADCDVQVIGFTTRAWKGGQSREKWLAEGRPARPGRLNDLRYIIYKDFDQSMVASVQNFGVMLREGLLKENIDGEALLFGRDELKARQADIRVLAVFSDGAPVDDSTLSVNSPLLLEKHLIESIPEVRKSSVTLMAVGIDHDVKRYYDECGVGSKAETLGPDFFKLFRSVLGLKKPPAPRKRR